MLACRLLLHILPQSDHVAFGVLHVRIEPHPHHVHLGLHVLASLHDASVDRPGLQRLPRLLINRRRMHADVGRAVGHRPVLKIPTKDAVKRAGALKVVYGNFEVNNAVHRKGGNVVVRTVGEPDRVRNCIDTGKKEKRKV